MRKLSNSDCDTLKDYDFARKTAKNEDYYGRKKHECAGNAVHDNGFEYPAG